MEALDPHGSAQLAETLPKLKERLLREGVSEAWLEEIKALVQPLQERAERFKDPPPQLQTVASILIDVRGWSRQIGELEKEVQDLEHQHQFVAADWTRDEAAIDKLLEEVRKLHERLTRRGQEIRSAKLRELEDYLGDLVQACGPQAGLEQKIAPLRELSVQRHQDHASWLKRYTAANDFFYAIAENEQASLAKRLGNLVEKLESDLEQVRWQPLSDRLKRQADWLEEELEQLRMLTGITETLKGLRQSKSLEERIEELNQQARQEKKDFIAQQENLRQRNAALLEQAARLGIEIEDASAATEKLTDNVAQLEAARRAADALAEELEGRRRRFVADCQKRLANHHEQALKVDEVLRKMTVSYPDVPTTAEIDPAAEPEQAGDAVIAAAKLCDDLFEVVDRELVTFDERRRETLRRLQTIPVEILGPVHREDAEQLLVESQEGSWAFADDPLDRLALLEQLDTKCAIFFQQIEPTPIPYTGEKRAVYRVSLTVPAGSVQVGGELEVKVLLSLPEQVTSEAYLLEIPHRDAADGELNVVLTAPGFQVAGDDVASLPLAARGKSRSSSDPPVNFGDFLSLPCGYVLVGGRRGPSQRVHRSHA